ncbi:MAG: cytochrome b/b6 domain-containing protein [Nitrospirota bacterium]
MSETVFIKRFNAYQRVLHIFMALSFLGLVASGMPLKYAEDAWAAKLMQMLFGSYHTAGVVHRVCAVVTFGYFFAHIVYVVYYIAIVRKFKFSIFGPESLVPRLKDGQDIYNNFRWFLGAGPRPRFDRWAYWEKFDYWAVFWGVGIIGMSGLILWFPVFFTRFLPGWIINVSTIIHSDEALLAAAFIFTIHFFNTHLRPEKFPMDTVIFTGNLSKEEMESEKPLEYERLAGEGGIEGRKVPPAPQWVSTSGIIFGYFLLVAGFILLFLIIYGQFF